MFEALTILMGEEQAESQIDDIFSSIDVDGSGECSMEEICMWYFTRAAKLRQIQKKDRAFLRAEFDDAMAKAQEFTQTPKTPPLELDARSQQSVRSKAPSRLDEPKDAKASRNNSRQTLKQR